MSYISGQYTNPNWVNDTTPAINADNLNDISNALEDITTATGGADSTADLLANIGAEPITNVQSVGDSGTPVYFDASGVAQTITPTDLNTTLGLDTAAADIATLQGQVADICGGNRKVVFGQASLTFSSATQLVGNVTSTGLSSVSNAVAVMRFTTGTPMNQTYAIMVRENYTSSGRIQITAYGHDYVSGHTLSVFWIAIGT